jgi:hypothetical protein
LNTHHELGAAKAVVHSTVRHPVTVDRSHSSALPPGIYQEAQFFVAKYLIVFHWQLTASCHQL